MIISNNELHRNAYFLDPTEDIEVLKDSKVIFYPL